jgi:hypothetical protein
VRLLHAVLDENGHDEATMEFAHRCLMFFVHFLASLSMMTSQFGFTRLVAMLKKGTKDTKFDQ